MDKAKKLKFRSLLTIVLIVIFSATMALAAACDNTSASDTSASTSDSASASESTSTRTDYQAISNGDFEYKHDDATSFPVTSSIGWTRSYDSLTTTAVTSDESSGIIDTTPGENYEKFAEDNSFPLTGDGYYNPGTPEGLGYIPADELYTEAEDVTNTEKLPTSGSYVLMIHNITSNGQGTAQKFTSSTTLTVSDFGKISVWVLTKDLSSKMENVDYGAYVSINNTLSSTKAPLVVKNINTNGEWQKVEFYIAASDYSSSTFKVVLGLGFGSKEYKAEYVEGLAFFDNIYYESLTAAEYYEATEAGNVNASFSAYKNGTVDSYTYNGATDNFDDNQVDVYEYVENSDLVVSYKDQALKQRAVGDKNYNYLAFAFSHKMPVTAYEGAYVSTGLTPERNDDNFVSELEYTMDTEIGYKSFNTIASAKIDGVENPLGDDASTLYIIHNNGASSTATLDLPYFFVPDGTALYITFLMKVQTGTNQNGLTINLIDKGSAKTQADSSSTMLSSIDTNDVENEDLNDWVRVNLFVTNFNGDKYERYFDLELNFGTTVKVQRQILLTEGYALITGIEGTTLSKEEYNAASRNGSYDASVALGAEIKNITVDEEQKDSYDISYSQSQATVIGTEVATNVTGYTGVVGGNKAVGGGNDDYTDENVVAGIINTKYLDNYNSLAAVKAELSTLTPDDENVYVQSLVIYNKQAASYGFVSGSATVSASSTSLVSVKLRVFGNATATVYLTGTDPLEGFEVLSIEGKLVNRDGNKPVYTTGSAADGYFNEELKITVTADDCADDWVTVNFLVTAGINGIPYRVEIFNGTRDGSTDSQGLVVIDSVKKTSANASTFKARTVAEFGTSDSDVTHNYGGVVKTVKYTDTDGFDAFKYTSDASEIEVYNYLANAKTMIVSYQNIDVNTEIDETTTEKDTSTDAKSDEEKEKEENYNFALYLTSIILAIVLIFVLVVVSIRLLFKKLKKENAVTETYYKRDSRERAQDVINRNKAKREEAAKKKAEEAAKAAETAETPADETVEETPAEEAEKAPEEAPAEEAEEQVKEYDYDNPENNI